MIDAMNESPLPLAAHQVRAVLSDAMTQMRWIVRPQPPFGCIYTINGAGTHALCMADDGRPPHDKTVYVPPTATSTDHRLACPYGVPGDRLWVRETWRTSTVHDHIGISRSIEYRADGANIAGHHDEIMQLPRKIADIDHWRPSIHMPRWASRIDLEIVAVRVERLQDLSEEDAKAGGVSTAIDPDGSPDEPMGTARGMFHALWNAINGDRATWESNPWVWALTFRRIDPVAP